MLHLALLLSALASFPAPDTFRAITFDQAKAAAQEEKKVILIDFFTTWCVPCKKLDETTWKEESVVKWLGEHCVSLKLDAEKNVELAKSFHVEAYPTVLLLKADGSVIDRLVGYKDAKEFLSDASDALAGKDSLARAKEKLAGHEKDPMEREHHADELARAGKYEEALAEYLWCFDEGKASVGYAGVRLSFLLSDIEDLGRNYPAAIKAMEQRRDAAEARVRSGTITFDDLADAVALNEHLDAKERSLTLFDDVKKAGPIKGMARMAFFLHLKEQLHQAKRYEDLLGLLDHPAKYVTGQIRQYKFTKQMSEARADKDKPEDPELSADTFLRSHTIEDGARIFEALVATKRDPEADQVVEALIAFDATGKTYAALIRAADRAGATDRVKALGDRGLASLPDKEQADVKKAMASAAKPK
jgi:thioredoxin-like negative regulator of GroEL